MITETLGACPEFIAAPDGAERPAPATCLSSQHPPTSGAVFPVRAGSFEPSSSRARAARLRRRSPFAGMAVLALPYAPSSVRTRTPAKRARAS